MKRELAIQQSRYNNARTGAQESQVDHPQGSTSPQASTLHLSSQPRYETPQRYVAPPFGLDPSLPFGLEHSLNRHEQHCANPTNLMQQFVSVLHQFGGRDTDKVKITEFKDIDETVTVSLVLCTCDSKHLAAGYTEPSMHSIFQKMKPGGNLEQWAISYQPTQIEQMRDPAFMPNWTWATFMEMLMTLELYQEPNATKILAGFSALRCSDSSDIPAAVKKYIATFEQHLRSVRAHDLTEYAATTGPALAQQLDAGLPKIFRTMMARRRPDLIRPELRDDYQGLKREIMHVLKCPDAISEFEKFKRHIVEYVPQVTAAHTTRPLDTDRDEKEDMIEEWLEKFESDSNG